MHASHVFLRLTPGKETGLVLHRSSHQPVTRLVKSKVKGGAVEYTSKRHNLMSYYKGSCLSLCLFHYDS